MMMCLRKGKNRTKREVGGNDVELWKNEKQADDDDDIYKKKRKKEGET